MTTNGVAQAELALSRNGAFKKKPFLTFICWKWNQPNFRTKYAAEHVNIWASMLQRFYHLPHRRICITDDPAGITEAETFPLWSDLKDLRNPSGPHLPSCYRRLKIFSTMQAAEMDIGVGEFIMSTDLDIVICNDLEDLLHKYPDSSFMGWKGVGAHQPTVYNGSLFRFRVGAMDFLWNEFDPVTSPRRSIEAKYFGSDQSWISYRLNGAAPGWGVSDGVLSYTSNLGQRSLVSGGQRRFLPPTARIVSFNGKRKPWEGPVRVASPWIDRFYKQGDSRQGEAIPEGQAIGA